MRLSFSKYVEALWKKLKPYLVFDKENLLFVLPDNAPDEIKEAFEEYGKLSDKECKEAEGYFKNLKVILKD